jgi:hypothetical protein
MQELAIRKPDNLVSGGSMHINSPLAHEYSIYLLTKHLLGEISNEQLNDERLLATLSIYASIRIETDGTSANTKVSAMNNEFDYGFTVAAISDILLQHRLGKLVEQNGNEN